MENEPIVIIPYSILLKDMRATLKELLEERDQDKGVELFTINQAAKFLNMAHTTVSKLVKDGHIEATQDNKRLTRQSINNYLKTNKNEK